MKLKCEECEMEPDYLWKEGRQFLPVCRICLKGWLVEDAKREGQVVSIDDIEDEAELEEMVNPGKRKK